MNLPWSLRAAIAVADYCLRHQKPPERLVCGFDPDFIVEFANFCYVHRCQPQQLARILQHTEEAREALEKGDRDTLRRHCSSVNNLAAQMGLEDLLWDAEFHPTFLNTVNGKRRRFPRVPHNRRPDPRPR